jgi:hypothetical protein
MAAPTTSTATTGGGTAAPTAVSRMGIGDSPHV